MSEPLCIHCGKSKRQHGLRCPGYPDVMPLGFYCLIRGGTQFEAAASQMSIERHSEHMHSIRIDRSDLTGLSTYFLEKKLPHARDLIGCIQGFARGRVENDRVSIDWRPEDIQDDRDKTGLTRVNIYWVYRSGIHS